jgi:hypothetical protein
MSKPVPAHMLSTVTLLRRGYPDGIPVEEQPVLMAVLGEIGMSDRSIAAGMGYYHDLPYVDFLYQASTCTLDAAVTEEAKEMVREKLRPFGFDQWAEED